MIVKCPAKIPPEFLAQFAKMQDKEGAESIYMACAHAWLAHYQPDAPFSDKWLDYLEEGLEMSHPYNPEIYHDEDGWQEYLGEIVGLAVECKYHLLEHFLRILPLKNMDMMDVEFSELKDEVVWIWTDEI